MVSNYRELENSGTVLAKTQINGMLTSLHTQIGSIQDRPAIPRLELTRC